MQQRKPRSGSEQSGQNNEKKKRNETIKNKNERENENKSKTMQNKNKKKQNSVRILTHSISTGRFLNLLHKTYAEMCLP
jgi:hypothetical protein